MTQNRMFHLIFNNVVSGISLACLIIFGVSYISFKNTEVYSDYSLSVINNPIKEGSDIMFTLMGTKLLDCRADGMYGIAVHKDTKETVLLTDFTSGYIRNVTPGERVTNSWSFARPDELGSGVWHTSIEGTWHCKYMIFTNTKRFTYDNILIIAE